MKKEIFQHVDCLEEFNGNLRLKRSYRYYTQVQAQMWVCGVRHFSLQFGQLEINPLWKKLSWTWHS